MALDSVAAVVAAIRGTPVLRPEQFAELESQHAPAHKDPTDLVRTMIRLRWLTVYQGKKILARRHDELVVGHYVVLDKLGEGGMGKVYKAIQLNLNRVVALKVVRGTLLKNETALKRFRREVKSAAALSHPNIVRVFDADQVGDRHFLAMEYIDGTDLGKLVKQNGPLPVPVACAYVRQAALGLQHAHDQAIVHRDIKPSNILVAVSEKGVYGPRNLVKVLDMGLARTTSDGPDDDQYSSELTRTGTVVGTPDFMSPEQAKNSSTVDNRSDLYALGCTFFYLLTGEVVFPDGNPLEKLLQHQMDAPRPVQLVRMDVPAEVASLVQCLLAKRPEQRFQSGAALAHALDPWCKATASSGVQPAFVLPAEEVVLATTMSLETGSPFDFEEADVATPTPVMRKLPPPLPAGPMPMARSRTTWIVAAGAAVAVLAVVVGIAAAMYFRKGRDKGPDDSGQPPADSIGRLDPPRKTDPLPLVPKELDSIEKYVPDDSAIVIAFDGKQWQASKYLRESILPPVAMSDRLKEYERATGTDLLTALDRVVVALPVDEKRGAVIVLQGKTLVTDRALAAMKGLPGVTVEGSVGGTEVVSFLDADRLPVYAAALNSSVVLSRVKARVVEAIDKRDGSPKTKFADSTVPAGLTFLATRAANGRPVAVSAVIATRTNWGLFDPKPYQLGFAAAALSFDDRGMHFHAMAEEAEAGKAAELLKVLGLFCEKLGKGDRRLEHIGDLLKSAKVVEPPAGKGKVYHAQTIIQARRLDTWFAPFVKPDKDK